MRLEMCSSHERANVPKLRQKCPLGRKIITFLYACVGMDGILEVFPEGFMGWVLHYVRQRT